MSDGRSDPICELHAELLALVRPPDSVGLFSLDPDDWSSSPRLLVWQNGSESGVSLTLYKLLSGADLSTWHGDGSVTARLPFSGLFTLDYVREIFSQASWRKRYGMDLKPER